MLSAILSDVPESKLFAIYSAALMAQSCREPTPGTLVLQIVDERGDRMPDVEASILELYEIVRHSPPPLVDFLLSCTVNEMSRRGIPIPRAAREVVRINPAANSPRPH